MPITIIQKAMNSFPGINRRFEILGEFEINNQKFTWIDDYGHHPTEMKEVIETISKVWKGQRLITIFQPHRYSRTAEHFHQFVDILKNVENLIIMDIYAANEIPIDNISSETILQEVKKYKVNAVLINEEKELAEYLNKTIKNNDILLTIGAGNISKFVNYYKKIVM